MKDVVVALFALLTAIALARIVYHQIRVGRVVSNGATEDELDLGAISPIGPHPPETDDADDLAAWNRFTGLLAIAAMCKARFGWPGVLMLGTVEVALAGPVGFALYRY